MCTLNSYETTLIKIMLKWTFWQVFGNGVKYNHVLTDNFRIELSIYYCGVYIGYRKGNDNVANIVACYVRKRWTSLWLQENIILIYWCLFKWADFLMNHVATLSSILSNLTEWRIWFVVLRVVTVSTINFISINLQLVTLHIYIELLLNDKIDLWI